MGVKDEERFPDDWFTSSSFRSASLRSFNARLDGDNAWCPSNSDTEPKLVLKLPQMQLEIVGLITQGYNTGGKHHYTRYYTVIVDSTVYVAGGENVR